MLFKNLLIGVSSVGIIGAGGYGIYSATRSDNKGEIDNNEGSNGVGENEDKDGSSSGSVGQGSGTEWGTQTTGDSISGQGSDGGIGSTISSPLITPGGGGSSSGQGNENEGRSGDEAT